MDDIPRLSESVYVGLCHEIGCPTEVRIRREVMDTVEAVYKPVYIMRGFDRMISGSQREGFRLRTSDFDFMFWPPDHKVICDLSQIRLYRIPQNTVILMECDDLPPGFTRLNLTIPSNDEEVISSCVEIDNKINISSTLFRDKHLRFLQTKNYATSSTSHGPCSTYCSENIESDCAFCFRSHHWPALALPWIQRCLQQGWPSKVVISDILRSGFHVVPIGSTDESILEWRISFSSAEQKLVYAMNHTQFLCYGLFKIFLKEVINLNEDLPVLCSYFTKTAVFWVIQTNNALTWTPENLLPCFWKCFKLLIYWVFTGECPNFFIPLNNMFRFKVTESIQAVLCNKLYELYCEGISSLLLSETLGPFLSQAILYRSLRVCTDESSIITKTELEISLFEEIHVHSQRILSVVECVALMKKIEIEISKRLTPIQEATVQFMTSEILRNTAMLKLCEVYQHKNCNKVYYKASYVSRLLKLSCTIGCVSDILYLAMYFYITWRFERSLSCLQKAQERMSKSYIIYHDNVNIDMYRRYTAGMSLCRKMRNALVKNIALHSQYIYIDELILEQKTSNNNGCIALLISPLVTLYMLFILNYHRLGDTVTSQQSLQNLQTLLLYDDGTNVLPPLRDISWQILGICQQICGDFQGALQSYQHSLQQYPFHKIKEATLFRINSLSQD
ncbi:uncharacterized protein LOC134255625 isoform X1 [Saccostrea cucullata]|uniref:uncharacterized protein LOC134255625 isoform X1 n=1 Tax=Saccostrea cuccullata TaxID=36930 RepID=UPI002ED2BA7C